MFGLCIVLQIAACSFLTSEKPPTLVPRATDTPLPTIGYATLRPDQFPTQVATAPPPFTAALLNLLYQIEADRLIIHVDSLQNVHTRHINSSYTTADQGIGAAAQYIMTQFQTIQAQSEGRFAVGTQEFPLTWAGISSRPKNVVGILNSTLR